VETLLDCSDDGDVTQAEAAIERLATAPVDKGLVIREIWLLRLRALLARARGEETGYRDYWDRYRARAASLGFEGHMKWAEAMPGRPPFYGSASRKRPMSSASECCSTSSNFSIISAHIDCGTTARTA
jgi:hypothetical protein